MPKTILSFGEILWDLLPSGARLGGAPFNFAFRVNSLDARGLIVSRLGRDEWGKKAWDEMIELGMDGQYMQWDERYPTGTVEITLDENNQPDYFIVPDVAYDYTEMTDGIRAILPEVDCICYGTLNQRIETSRHTIDRILDSANSALKLFDINLRKNCYTTETIIESLERADVLKLNDDEVLSLSNTFALQDSSIPDFCDSVLDRWSLSLCLVTLGNKGAFAATKDERIYIPGYQVNLVDPCGSGDAFTAGFIVRYLDGHPLADCCQLGNTLGAIVATQTGATIPISNGEIEDFLRAGHERTVDPDLRSFCVESFD